MTYRCFMIWFLQHSMPGLPVQFVIFWVLFLSLFSLAMLADFSALLLSHFSFLPVNSIIRWLTLGLLLKQQCILSLLYIKATSAWIWLYWQPTMRKQSFLRCLHIFSKRFKTSELTIFFGKLPNMTSQKYQTWLLVLVGEVLLIWLMPSS